MLKVWIVLVALFGAWLPGFPTATPAAPDPSPMTTNDDVPPDGKYTLYLDSGKKYGEIEIGGGQQWCDVTLEGETTPKRYLRHGEYNHFQHIEGFHVNGWIRFDQQADGTYRFTHRPPGTEEHSVPTVTGYLESA